MGYIKYKLGKVTYYIRKKPSTGFNLGPARPSDLLRAADFAICEHKLVKNRYGAEALVDTFTGISKEPRKTVNLQLMEDMADE